MSRPAGRRRLGPVDLAAIVVLGLVAARVLLAGVTDQPALQNWSTVFVAVTVQAMPFLVLGVAISGAVATFLSPERLARWLPRNRAVAVPVAALAGVVMPGCECGSVPVAARLAGGGVPGPAALTFLLAAPAVNPVVMVATAVAFPGRPEMVLARFLSSILAATVVGLLWTWKGDDSWTERLIVERPQGRAVARFSHAVEHDLLVAGGFLVLGAALTATLQTLVPRSVLDSVATSGPIAVLALGALAVLLAICSEADAFVAAGLAQFSLTARLAFLTVGPMVDVKLVALQAGTFGPRFARRFAPLTFVVAIASAVAVGSVLL
jgi:hypothetical protein